MEIHPTPALDAECFIEQLLQFIDQLAILFGVEARFRHSIAVQVLHDGCGIGDGGVAVDQNRDIGSAAELVAAKIVEDL